MTDFGMDRKSGGRVWRALTRAGLRRQHESIAAAPHVGLDQQLAAAAEAGAVDLQVLHPPVPVMTRLSKRYAPAPGGRIDRGLARVAVGGDPLPHTAAAGIV